MSADIISSDKFRAKMHIFPLADVFFAYDPRGIYYIIIISENQDLYFLCDGFII